MFSALPETSAENDRKNYGERRSYPQNQEHLLSGGMNRIPRTRQHVVRQAKLELPCKAVDVPERFPNRPWVSFSNSFSRALFVSGPSELKDVARAIAWRHSSRMRCRLAL